MPHKKRKEKRKQQQQQKCLMKTFCHYVHITSNNSSLAGLLMASSKTIKNFGGTAYKFLFYSHSFFHSIFYFFFFFFGYSCSMCKFLGQGSNPSHSSDLSHCSDNTESLTCCAPRELPFPHSYLHHIFKSEKDSLLVPHFENIILPTTFNSI